MRKNRNGARGAQAPEESMFQVSKSGPGILARIAAKMGFRSSPVITVFGARARTMRTNHSLVERISTHPWLRYGLPAIAVVAILTACHALSGFVNTATLYILLFPVIFYSALACGVGPSILTMVTALVGIKYWFVPPIHSFRFFDTFEVISILAFVFASGAIVAMGEARRRHNQRLRDGQTELEVKVQQRTLELDTANQSLRDLSARLMQLQDDERRRIARELHDSVGQLLAGLSMNLANVRGDIEQLSRTAKSLTDSEALVQEMSQEVRTISHLLHPPLLDEAGLVSAIHCYVDGFAQRSKIEVALDLPEDFPRFSPELETAIFRVVQECLTNIHRHSGSSVAKIQLRHPDGQVLVEVADKGKGIPSEKHEELVSAGTPGVGIRGMRERIRQLGGTLEITSNGTGTFVLATFPVAQNSLTEGVSPISETTTAAA